MKKLFTLVSVALMASAAWAGVVTLDMNKPLNPASLEYNDLGIWTQCYNDADYTWLEFGDENGEFMLSHLIDGPGASWGGYYWDGFTPAIGGDQTDYGQPGSSASWTTYFGGCMAGGGCVINEDGSVTADPAQPYFVGYYSSWAMEGPSNQVIFVDKDGSETFEPVGVYVCNHPWPYYGCEHGDGFGEPFAEGDYFELIAVGVAPDRTEKRVSINLVEFTDGQLIALNDWTFFDLSELGEVTSVYFELNSTDTGDYGMNTAAYFCMDKFQVKVEDEPVVPPTPGEPCAKPEGGFENGTDFHGVTVTLVNNETAEGAELHYNITLNGELIVEDAVYDEPFALTQDGDYYIDFWAVAPGMQNSSHGGLIFTIDPTTGLSEVAGGKTVAGVRYYNMAGQEMQQAEGLTIVVTTYTDGTTSAVKVIK